MNSTITKQDNGDIFHTYEIILNEINIVLMSVWRGPYKYFPATYQTTFDTLSNQAGFDHLDALNLIITLEDTFGISIDDNIVQRSNTIGDFIKKIALLTGILKDNKSKPDVSTKIQPISQPKASPEYLDVKASIDDLDVKPSTEENLGILILPSLEEHGRLISIQSISLNEAEMFIKNFAKQVIATRKVNYYQQNFETEDVTHMEFFHNMIRYDEMNEHVDASALDHEFESFINCQVPKTRGFRALFVSPTVIGIGTTVIFNKNWATINFEDYTLLSKIQAIAAKYFTA